MVHMLSVTVNMLLLHLPTRLASTATTHTQKKKDGAPALTDINMITTRETRLRTERYSGYCYAFLEERSQG